MPLSSFSPYGDGGDGLNWGRCGNGLRSREKDRGSRRSWMNSGKQKAPAINAGAWVSFLVGSVPGLRGYQVLFDGFGP